KLEPQNRASKSSLIKLQEHLTPVPRSIEQTSLIPGAVAHRQDTRASPQRVDLSLEVIDQHFAPVLRALGAKAIVDGVNLIALVMSRVFEDGDESVRVAFVDDRPVGVGWPAGERVFDRLDALERIQPGFEVVDLSLC